MSRSKIAPTVLHVHPCIFKGREVSCTGINLKQSGVNGHCRAEFSLSGDRGILVEQVWASLPRGDFHDGVGEFWLLIQHPDDDSSVRVLLSPDETGAGRTHFVAALSADELNQLI